MTFSLAARCPSSGAFGIVISSSSPAVAARCAHVRAAVGAACTQNITDPRLGPALLDELAGAAAPDALAALVAREPTAAYRQLTVVDAQGRTAAFSGEHTLGLHASAQGDGAVAAGNLLASDAVPTAMVEAFASAGPTFGDRLVAALRAAGQAGGEAGPVRSAGLLIADRVAWPVADLRVDWHDDPLSELERLWRLWEPQLEDYVKRAIDPTAAPSYGVPGDP